MQTMHRIRWGTRLGRLAVAFTALSCLARGAWAFELGVTTHVGQNVQSTGSTLDALQALGVTSVRDEAFWAKVERTAGKFEVGDDLEQFARFVPAWRGKGGNTMLIATYGNRAYGEDRYPLTDRGRAAYARYARFLVDRFGKDMAYLEIWNEWNRGFGMNDAKKHEASAENYVKVLEAVARAMPIGATRPRLVAGAVEGRDDAWIDEFARFGGLRWADFLSLHPYVHHADQPPEASMRWLDRLHERLQRRSPDRVPPFLITEIGWPVGKGARQVDEETAAAYLIRFLLLARSRPWIAGVWWYSLELSSNEKARFSLVRAGGRKTVAFDAFRMLAPYIRRAVGVSQEILPGGVYRVSLQLEAGRYLTAFWTEKGSGPAMRVNFNESDAREVTWVRDGKPHDSKPRDGRPRDGKPRDGTNRDGDAALAISSIPVLIEHGGARPAVANAADPVRPLPYRQARIAVQEVAAHE